MRGRGKFWKVLINEKFSAQTPPKSLGIISLILTFGIIGPAFSGDNSYKNPKSTTFNKLAQQEFVHHTNGNLWIAWDNLGNTGDISCSATIPAFFYPGGTPLSYLCRGGYWIVSKGNLVDSDGQSQIYLEGATGEYVPTRGTVAGPVSQGWATAMDPANFPPNDYSQEPWISKVEWHTIAGLKVVATRYSWSYQGKTNNFFKIGDPVEYFDFNDFVLEDISITYDGDLNGDGTPDAQAVETIDQVVLGIKADHDCVWNVGPAGFLENFWDDDGVDFDEETLTSFELDGDRGSTAEDDTGLDDPVREWRGVHVGQTHVSTPPVKLLVAGEFMEFPDKEPIVSHMWWTGENDPQSPASRFQFATAAFNALDEFTTAPEDFTFDPNLEGDLKKVNSPVTDMRYMAAYGPWPISKNETIRIVTAPVAGSGLEGGKNAARAAKQAFAWNYNLPKPPPAPKMVAEEIELTADIRVRVYWENDKEDAMDPDLGRADFAGYRIYRSALGPLSDSKEILIKEELELPSNIDKSKPFAGDTGGPYQVIQEISKSELSTYQIGTSGNTKQYEIFDGNVALGFDYWYYVAAYDEGEPAMNNWQGTPLPNGLPSLESYRTMNYPLNEVGTPSAPPKIAVSLPAATQESFTEDGVFALPNPWRPNEFDKGVIFLNVPPRAVIKIFDVQGHLVDTIVKDDEATSDVGQVEWNVFSRTRTQVVAGIYFYRVEDLATGAVKFGKLIVQR